MRVVQLGPLAIVFIASFCTLVIELIAARIMAPYIGVSLYTWTSIIGVCLAGIAAGNYAGGKIADRAGSERTLAILFLLSGGAAMAMLPLVDWVVGSQPLREWPLVARIVVHTTLVFFPPTFLLGTISPVVIKLSLTDLATTGSTVGRIYAVSTAGAIAGTFATGFWLVDAFGTRSIVWGVAVALLLLGLLIGRVWKRRARAVAATILIATLIASNDARASYRAPCVDESAYYCIAVLDAEVDGRKVKSLALDFLVHSYVDPQDPTFIGYGYERVYDEITDRHVRNRTEFATLSIGGGGYTYPRYLIARYPAARVDVLEIDPSVTRAAREHLALASDPRLVTYHGDARLWFIDNAPVERYDVIYGDAYNDLSIPFHLTTLEFDRMIKRSLKPDGILMTNIIDNYDTGEFLRAYVRTLSQVFEHVYLLGHGRTWERGGAATHIVLASSRPFDIGPFVARDVDPSARTVVALDPARLGEFLSRGRYLVLTDDHAPVDNLVAPIFIERESW